MCKQKKDVGEIVSIMGAINQIEEAAKQMKEVALSIQQVSRDLKTLNELREKAIEAVLQGDREEALKCVKELEEFSRRIRSR